MGKQSILYKCIICGKKFNCDWRTKYSIIENAIPLYCSRKCSNTRRHSQETKDKISKSMYKGKGKNCIICNKRLRYKNKTNICNDCKIKKKPSQSVIDCRKRRKEFLVNYKGGKCERCGYNKYIGALEFHHINPKEKDFELRTSATRSVERDINEVNKCSLLCSNCHKEVHEEKRQKDKGEKMEKRDFESDVKFNKYKLEDECEKHASIYWYWADRLAKAKNNLGDSEDELKLTSSQTEQSIRQNWEKDYFEKFGKQTEAGIKSAIEQDKNTKISKEKVREYQHEVNTLIAAVSAMEHRRDMLKCEKELLIGGFYASPDMNKKDSTKSIDREINSKLNKKKG